MTDNEKGRPQQESGPYNESSDQSTRPTDIDPVVAELLEQVKLMKIMIMAERTRTDLLYRELGFVYRVRSDGRSSQEFQLLNGLHTYDLGDFESQLFDLADRIEALEGDG